MEEKAKIYVSGHRGMVGSAVFRELKDRGYTNLIVRTRRELDLLNQKDVRDFFKWEKPEFVVLCAARVGGIHANMKSPAEFLYQNLEMQNNVIWSAHEMGVKKLLFLGSSCIYPREAPQPMKEEYLLTGPVEPTNEGYAIAKIAGVKLCEKIAVQHGKQFFSCMPTNIYGENADFSPDNAHVIPALIRRMSEAKNSNKSEVEVWGTGNARREFLHVQDLANAIVWLMENYDGTEMFNIGTGEDISIREIANLVKDVVGYERKIVFDSSKPDGMPRRWLDVSKLHETGWHHSIEIEEGLKRTYAWYLEKVAG
jgi:GDP-L-fucose synthase